MCFKQRKALVLIASKNG